MASALPAIGAILLTLATTRTAGAYRESDPTPDGAHGRIAAFAGRSIALAGKTAAVRGAASPLGGKIAALNGRISPLGGRVSPLDAILADLGAVVGSGEIRIDVPVDRLFDPKKTELNAVGGATLDKIATVLQFFRKSPASMEGTVLTGLRAGTVTDSLAEAGIQAAPLREEIAVAADATSPGQRLAIVIRTN